MLGREMDRWFCKKEQNACGEHTLQDDAMQAGWSGWRRVLGDCDRRIEKERLRRWSETCWETVAVRRPS